MAITAQIQGSALLARLRGFSTNTMSILADRLRIETGLLAEYIKREKLSGQVLKNRTGNLRNSVFPSISQDISGPTGMLTGTVAVDNTAFYGKIHEYGGTFLAQRKGGVKLHGRSRVTGLPYTVRFPERAFMRPSLEERGAAIAEALQQALNQALKK